MTEFLREELAGPWHDHPLEVATAALMALATVASAWCAYQAARWGGIQTFRLTDANVASRESIEKVILANETRMQDWAMFMQFIDAMETGNQPLMQFYRARFRPEMKTAVEAWLATNPMSAPDAPTSPFVMPQYQVAWGEQARALQHAAAGHHLAAEQANQQSDEYVLLTVLFTSVLFFGGIATHFHLPRIKVAVFMVGLAVFLGSAARLATYPPAH